METLCRRCRPNDTCVALHGLRQLGIHLIRDQHDVRQNQSEIHRGQVTLDGLEGFVTPALTAVQCSLGRSGGFRAPPPRQREWR